MLKAMMHLHLEAISQIFTSIILKEYAPATILRRAMFGVRKNFNIHVAAAETKWKTWTYKIVVHEVIVS
jgi:molybdopterin biosynthesis enzyme MoaB